MTRRALTLLFVLVGLILTACSGSGSGDGNGEENHAPTAYFTITPDSGQAPIVVNFDASGSSDPDGDPLDFTWDFGDGQSGVGVSPSHEFAVGGSFSVTLTVSDGRGGNDQATATITVTAPADTNHPPQATFTANPQSGEAPLGVAFDASGSSDTDGDALTFQWVFGDGTSGSGATASHVYATAGSYEAILTVSDPDNAQDTAQITITVSAPSTGDLPPDPSDVAPELSQTASTPIGEAVAFLYQHTDPIQSGVDPADIDPDYLAVLRGRVNDRTGNPLPGVTITILNHGEYGWTLSRSDGMFDLAVNGGSYLTLVYEKEGYLTAQRPVEAPWRDFVILPDVVMIPLDKVSTTINFSQPMQVAQGSQVSDERGDRQSTLMFPQATMARMVFADGSSQDLSRLTVRSTEYTTGDAGPRAMPGPLPHGVAYTYAAELSVDEAMAAGAVSVEFTGPVFNYVENFLNFPVGEPVPAYYFDRLTGSWRGMDPGVVIKIVSETDGLAAIDADGDGAAEDDATLTALAMTIAERQRLAALYEPNQTLWRVPLTHFTPVDYNWPPVFPPGAVPPNPPAPVNMQPEENSCEATGSIVECQGQVLGERLPITGTPFSLNYRSDRAPGHGGAYVVDIPLIGDTIPADCEEVRLKISVAGREFEEVLTDHFLWTSPYRFTWDGLDAYGRAVKGRQPITVAIGYAYAVVYRCSSEGCTADPLLGLETLWKEWKGWTGSYAFSDGLGGWHLSVHHNYDANEGMLHLGTGRRTRSRDLAYEIRTVAGGGEVLAADGVPATMAKLSNCVFDVHPDGSIILSSDNQIFRLGADGVLVRLAGQPYSGYAGDGGKAIDALFWQISDIDVGPDGSIYISDYRNHRIRKITPDGLIDTVAGNGTITDGYGSGAFSGDGGLATEAAFDLPYSTALASDGSIYIHDSENFRVRKVDADGIVTTVMGNGSKYQDGCSVGVQATSAIVSRATGLAVDNEGRLVASDSVTYCIRRIENNGVLSRIAGTGVSGYSGDGGPAVAAQLEYPKVPAIGPDGTIYFSDRLRVRRIGPDGIINTIAGNGIQGSSGDNGPALEAALGYGYDSAIGPDRSFYMVDNFDRPRQIIPTAISKFLGQGPMVPSEDGTEVYFFDVAGRHQSTVDSRTGAVKYFFTYDEAGLLATVEDTGGRVTTIERGGDGRPTAVVSPYGQRTALAVDGNGYLATVANPAGEVWAFSYLAGGLLVSFVDPKNNTSAYAYDDVGRLIENQDAGGGGQTLARSDSADVPEYHVIRTTAEGRVSTYQVEDSGDGVVTRTNSGCCGATTATIIPDGTTTISFANGMTRSETIGQDPRFGNTAPVVQASNITTPGGLSFSTTGSHQVALSNAEDLLSVETTTDTMTINGRTFTQTYDGATHTTEILTPEGRQSVTMRDEYGHVIERRLSGMNPLTFSYDGSGRLAGMSFLAGLETAQMSYTYDAQGRLVEMEDPLGRTASFQYDQAGRVTSEIMPDGTTKSYAREVNGYLSAITLATGATHSFSYNAAGLLSAYSPPAIGQANGSVTFEYDLDRHLTRVNRPDGRSIALTYDDDANLSSLTVSRGTYFYQRHGASGTLQAITSPEGNGLVYTLDGSLVTGLQWTGDISGRIDWQFNDDFKRVEERVNQNQVVQFTYNKDGQLNQAGDQAIFRDLTSGKIIGTAIGNVSDSTTLDGLFRTLTYEADYSGNPLYACAYTYDKISRILTRTETVGGESHVYAYGYDLMNRLNSITIDGGNAVAVTYDGNGNRLTYTASGTTTATYDDQDRLLAYGDLVYEYSAHGDLAAITDTGTDDETVYVYDELGNLLSVTLADGTLIDYIIDGANRRVGKKVNAVSVSGWLYNSRLHPVAELDGAGSVVSRFVYGDKSNVPSYMLRGGSTYRIISDHLGSPRLVVNVNTGQIAQRMDYDAWGNVTQDSSPGFQPFGFAGGLYDPLTRLVRFGARDYDARTGRWTTKDPVGFSGGANLYLYSRGEPLGRKDISGLQQTLDIPGEVPDEDVLAPAASPSRINDLSWQECANKCDYMFRRQQLVGLRHDARNWRRDDMHRRSLRNGEQLGCALRGEDQADAYDIWMNECVTNVWCADYGSTHQLTDEEREMEFFQDHPFEYIYHQISELIRSDDYFEPQISLEGGGGGARF